MNELPRKAIASLGIRTGQASRRKRGYIMLPLEDAQQLKQYLSRIAKEEYQKEYRKL